MFTADESDYFFQFFLHLAQLLIAGNSEPEERNHLSRRVTQRRLYACLYACCMQILAVYICTGYLYTLVCTYTCTCIFVCKCMCICCICVFCECCCMLINNSICLQAVCNCMYNCIYAYLYLNACVYVYVCRCIPCI